MGYHADNSEQAHNESMTGSYRPNPVLREGPLWVVAASPYGSFQPRLRENDQCDTAAKKQPEFRAPKRNLG